MDDSWLILYLLVALVSIGLAIRGLVTGRLGIGGNAWDRRTQPAEFWFHTAMGAIVIPLAILILFVGEVEDTWWVLALILVPQFLFPVIRQMQTGSAAIGSAQFDRSEEPREYWLAMLFPPAFVVLAFGLATAAGWLLR